MFSVDGVPVLSQMKAAVLLAKGDSFSAAATQENFTKKCVGVAQMRCGLQVLRGSFGEAGRTHEEFIENAQELFNQCGDVVDGIPCVSQLKSVVHLSRLEYADAFEIQNHFSRR